MSNRLQKVLRLAKQTGDRVVVFDNSEPETSFVVMPLDEYQSLLGLEVENSGLTEDENIDKVEKEKIKEPLDSGFPQENIYSSAQVIKNRFSGNNWKIPKEIKESATEEQK